MSERSYRLERINALVASEVASILQFELREKNIGFITITGAKVSPDLYHAVVYFTLHDESKLPDTKAVLKQKASYFTHLLGKRIHLRRTPKLSFSFDESVSRGSRITELLNKVEG